MNRNLNSTRLRAGGSLVFDQIREPLFDTYKYIDAEALNGNRVFFNDIKSKTPDQTNMRIDGQLENGVSFLIQGIAVDAINVNPANAGILANIMEKSHVYLRIGEKNYWEGPVRFAAGRNSMFAITTVVDTTYYQEQFGRQAVAGVILNQDDSLVLESQQSFSVVMGTNGALGAVDTELNVVVSLKGLKRRPVQ